MTREALLSSCETFMTTLEEMGARVAHQLRVGDGRIREDTIDEALALFLDARLIVAHDTGPEPIYTIDLPVRERPPSRKNSMEKPSAMSLRR